MKFIWILFALFLLPTGSFAQSQRNPCFYTSTPGASGNTGCIPVSSSNPLPVTSGSGISAGLSASFPITPTVAASSHASGSSVGGLQTVAFFRASSTFTGILNNIQWNWKTGTNLTAVTVYVFSANPTGSTCTDATAVSIAAADVSKLIAGSPFTLTPTIVGTGATFSTAFQQSPIAVKNSDGTPGQNLYFCTSVNATVTPAANDAILIIAGIQD